MGQPVQQDVDVVDHLADLIKPKPLIRHTKPNFEAGAEGLHQQQGLGGGKEGALPQRAIPGATSQIHRRVL